MDGVKEYDTYQIKRNGIISDYDQKIVIRLYQPIIGPIATMLYLTLVNEDRLEHIVADNRKHFRLFHIMDIDEKTFIKNRQKLESIGLLNTLIKENDDHVSLNYLYSLNSPKSPNQFFQDSILSNMLLTQLGEDEYHRTQCFYLDNSLIDENYVDITSTYEKTFSENKKIKNLNESFPTWKTADVNTNYDFDKLMERCHNEFIPKYVFTEKVKKEIIRLKLLFNLEDEDLIICIKDAICTDKRGAKKINLDTLNQSVEQIIKFVGNNSAQNSEDFEIATRLDNQEPLEFYRVLLDIPSLFKQDILLVNDFLKMGINKGVINVVLQYCVQNNQSKFSSINNYANKVMSSVVKAKCKDAYQTMIFLRNSNKKTTNIISNKTNTNPTKEADDIDMDLLLKIVGD